MYKQLTTNQNIQWTLWFILLNIFVVEMLNQQFGICQRRQCGIVWRRYNRASQVCRAESQHIKDLLTIKQRLAHQQQVSTEEQDLLDQLGDADSVEMDLAGEDIDQLVDEGMDDELSEFLQKYQSKNQQNSWIFGEESTQDDNDLESLEAILSEEELIRAYNDAAQASGLPLAHNQQDLNSILSDNSASDTQNQLGLMDSEWTVKEKPTEKAKPSEEAIQMSSGNLLHAEQTIQNTNEILAKVSPQILKQLDQQPTKERLGSSPGGQNFKVQRVLRIISGSLRGKKLISPQYSTNIIRPMMERVRGAVFDMAMSMYGQQLPSHTRWLDLYAGTGSVGLEALSRGCGEAHFVECDSQVVKKCLKANIEACRVEEKSFIYPVRVEDFLRRQDQKSLSSANDKFDFVTICPPYLLVSYPELFQLFNTANILHGQSVVFIEYPKNLADQLGQTIGPLKRIKDKSYGRTLVAVYGPSL
eukprot:TRINITY_DN10391_c3_g1_i1.p1 TRINITY_DN10391_c3_g1~~TRINITY_DN10391_c3_g1_i1.p1  ORF type:complete len:473 (-),score=47.53 TRINITY_DN10391_c3_g1_i1:972-2390(-)